MQSKHGVTSLKMKDWIGSRIGLEMIADNCSVLVVRYECKSGVGLSVKDLDLG